MAWNREHNWKAKILLLNCYGIFFPAVIYSFHTLQIKYYLFLETLRQIFTLVYYFLSAFYIFVTPHNVSSLNRWCCWMHSQIFLASARMGKNILSQDIHNLHTKNQYIKWNGYRYIFVFKSIIHSMRFWTKVVTYKKAMTESVEWSCQTLMMG